MSELVVGAKAPVFSAPDQSGKTISLSDFKGKKVVLYFYPKDDTPGCTVEACAFRDRAPDLAAAGARVIGLSSQAGAEQVEAAKRLHLPFALLSDPSLRLAQAIGLPTFHHEGKTYFRRLSLVIDDGRITHVFYPVFPPDRHPADVVAWLRAHPR